MGSIELLPRSCRDSAAGCSEPAPAVFAATVDGGVVRLVGELDLAGVREATAALVPADGDLVVDCSGLTFFGAAGLEVLIRAQRTCRAAGVELVVVDPPRCVTMALELTGLDRRFPIRRSR